MSVIVVPGTSVADPRGSAAPTIVPKPAVSKRTIATAATPRSCAISSATTEKSSTGSGSTATASWIRCSAVRAVEAIAVQDRDDAGHEAELVAACDPAALQREVGAVLVQVAVRPGLREHVVRVDEAEDRCADELVRRVAEQPLDRVRAGRG